MHPSDIEAHPGEILDPGRGSEAGAYWHKNIYRAKLNPGAAYKSRRRKRLGASPSSPPVETVSTLPITKEGQVHAVIRNVNVKRDNENET